ncbi:MAG: CHAT domain-containing protein [Phenylobacterium sp.]
MALGLLLAAFGSAGAARAALSDNLCNPYASAGPQTWPRAGELDRAAAGVETELRRRGPSGRFGDLLQSLDLPASDTARPSPAEIADYCAAAGELMRISPEGSQRQAEYYLLSAFQTARAARLQSVASVAAYRLGLVSLSGPSMVGARGARPARGGATAAIRGAQQVAGGEACDLLETPQALLNANVTLSLASLACSAEQGAQAGDNRTAALASLRLARLRLALAESDTATATVFRAQAVQAALAGLSAARGIADPALRSEIQGRLAFAILDARPRETPDLEAVAQAMAAAQPNNAAALSFADALGARLAFAAGDTARAHRLMDEALIEESQRALPARLPEWRLLLAEIDSARRESHILAAYDALDAIRPLLPRFDPLTEETAYSLYMRRVFQSAVDLDLSQASGALEQVRVRDAQKIVEAYRQAELQSVYGSECVPERDPLRPESLAAGEVLLYPVLLPDRLELLYVVGGPDGRASFRRLAPNRAVDREAVSRLVEQVVLSLSYDNDNSWRAPSRRLYDLLIKPVEPDLTPGSILVIVPDGALRGLPFSALLDADNHFLVERTRVSVAPSLAYSQPGGDSRTRGLQLVAASLEMKVQLPAGDFEKLEGTAAEAKMAAVVDGKRIGRSWIIDNFKREDLVRVLTEERVDILHLATHASFNGRSDHAFIVANGEVILLSELRQILAQNRTRGDELDLLVLSACETAVGDDEASMGLAGAAVQAGARSAVASLWPVNDVGTGELMDNFYRRYREGRSKSAALRDAQLAMIAKGGAEANPNIWAAFTLLGAWR